MKINYPNASALSILTHEKTVGQQTIEQILFIYLKPVPDISRDMEIAWFSGYGKDGKSKMLWEKLSVKQWFAFGNDNVLSAWYDKLIEDGKVVIQGAEITIPAFVLNPHPPVSKKSRRVSIADTLTIKDPSQIPPEFYLKENLDALSGYKLGSGDVKAVFPLGFYEQNFIHSNLQNGVFGIKEYRTPYLTFRGVRAKKDAGAEEGKMVGFYQEVFDEVSEYTALVSDEQGERLGTAPIAKDSGFFKADLTVPTIKGNVEIYKGELIARSIDYTLLQGIQINAVASATTFKDEYGRSFMLSSEKKNRPTIISASTWQRDMFADPNKADQTLSDKFKLLFDYLGPKILIADPYYLGPIRQDKLTGTIALSHCQRAILNAMVHSAVEKGIEEIHILGHSPTANQHGDHDPGSEMNRDDERFAIYEKILSGLVSNNKLERYFKKGTIQFKNSKKRFHPRYWFSMIDDNGISVLKNCIIVTNSIGNISEVDLNPVSDESQLKQITRRYTDLFKNADPKLII